MKKKVLTILCGCLAVSMLTGCSVIDKFIPKQKSESEVNMVESTISDNAETEEEEESIIQTETVEETQDTEKTMVGMRFAIQKSFQLSDRGTSVTGIVQEGTLHVGDTVTIKLADGTEIQNVVAGIEIFGDATKTSAETGENVGVWFEEDIKETLDDQCEMYCEGSDDEEEEIVLYDEDNVKIVVKDVIYQKSDQFELVLNTEITNNTPNKLTIQARDKELTDPDGNALESEDIIFSATVSPGETVENEMTMANNTSYNDNPQEMEGVRFRLYISAFFSDENLSDYIDITGIQEQNIEVTIEEGTGEKKGDINSIKE